MSRVVGTRMNESDVYGTRVAGASGFVVLGDARSGLDSARGAEPLFVSVARPPDEDSPLRRSSCEKIPKRAGVAIPSNWLVPWFFA